MTFACRTLVTLVSLTVLLFGASFFVSLPKSLQESFKKRKNQNVMLSGFGAKKGEEEDREHPQEGVLLTGGPPSSRKYFLCAYTNVKNEQFYLAQWLEYHRLMGFEQFFLADDCSHDRTWELLSIYQAEGLVTGYKTPNCPESHKADESKLLSIPFAMAKESCEYLMLFDADEYITRQNDLYRDGNLKDYVKATSPLFMRFFGQIMSAESLVLKPKGLMIATHTHGARLTIPPRPKTLAIHDLPERWSFPHYPNKISSKYKKLQKQVRKKFASKDELRTVRLNGEEVTAFTSPFFFNHFQVLSLAEYLCGRAARPTTASGIPNNWSDKPMTIFKEFSAKPYNQTAISQDFTLEMVPKVEAALNKMKVAYPEQWFFF